MFHRSASFVNGNNLALMMKSRKHPRIKILCQHLNCNALSVEDYQSSFSISNSVRTLEMCAHQLRHFMINNMFSCAALLLVNGLSPVFEIQASCEQLKGLYSEHNNTHHLPSPISHLYVTHSIRINKNIIVCILLFIRRKTYQADSIIGFERKTQHNERENK